MKRSHITWVVLAVLAAILVAGALMAKRLVEGPQSSPADLAASSLPASSATLAAEAAREEAVREQAAALSPAPIPASGALASSSARALAPPTQP